MGFTSYIKQIKKVIIQKRKWRKVRGFLLDEIDGEKFVVEPDWFIAAGESGSIDGYKCRRCGHFQTKNDEPCGRCGW